MAAGVTIKQKRKAGSFTGGQLSAGEMGINTSSRLPEFSADGTNNCIVPTTHPVTLTDGATVTIDPTLGHHFVLSGSTGRTLAIGTAGYDGQTILIRWKNTGGSPITHTLDTGASNKFRYLGTANSLNATAAGASEYIVAQYQDADDRWDVIGYSGADFPAISLTSAPTFVAAGSEFSGTGVPTATLPAGAVANDILVLVLQTSNEGLVAAPSGYTQLGPQNGIGTGAAAGANRLCIFWKRHSGSESAPTIPDTGDHTYGMMFAIRGCPTSGDPFAFGGNNWKFTASTSGSGPASVTHVDNTLVIDIFAGSADNASAEGSSLTNADLSSLTEQFDDGTTDGTGGFLYVASGLKAQAGPVTNTTVTWANSSSDLCTRIHFIPVGTTELMNASRGAELQIFIGSPTDADDKYIKPTGARKVFAQQCDGGGGGSGGNTTTTAAGGGGGGGGGYDEAWYNADELAASVTVHAGKGGNAGTALNQAGTAGVLSEFDKGNAGPLTSTRRIAGTAATAAASADGGNGGCGSGRGTSSPAVQATRRTLNDANAARAVGGSGAPGGSGTTAPTGGSEADWGGGGGESGGDTDAAITPGNNGSSMRGAGGGAGGRTNGTASRGGDGGAATNGSSTQGAAGTDSTKLPYGGTGGNGGGSTTVTGGTGGFPGGGGGGGAGVAGGFGGRGGHGCVVVTTYF